MTAETLKVAEPWMLHAEIVESAEAARTLGPRFDHWVGRQPDKLFARCDGRSLTYAEADRETACAAATLQALGVGKGDRVALISASRLELAVALVALGRMGAVAVPLNIYLKGEFLRFQVRDCQASVAIVDADGLASLAAVAGDLPDLRHVLAFDALPDRCPLPATIALHAMAASPPPPEAFVKPVLSSSDPAAIIYTSGTTGMPKGCVCSQGYLMAYCLCSIEDDWIRHDDILFSTFPLFHSAGYFNQLVATIQTGASVVFEVAFSASNFARRVSEEGATTAYGVGAVGMAVLATDASEYERANTLRLCSFPPMPPAGQEAFEARFGCEVVCCAYGQTEMAPIAHLSAADARAMGRGALGRPSRRLEVRLVDDDDQPVAAGETGEIVARPREPDIMFQGYWNRPEATVAVQRNLWHHTGDLARFDEHGLLYFVDRKKDAMRRRGENVSSVELERAILKHPQVKAVATHAVPSELGEDEIKACIVLVEGAELAPAELFAFFQSNLPYYAVPRYVEVMDALPTNALGRVMKTSLRDRGVGPAIDFEKLGLSIARDQRRG